VPAGVGSVQALVYAKCSPGASSGCWPTTPAPRTSCTRSSASVMIQWREINCAATVPVLRMVIV
jgi:hypothetical protein